MRATAVIVAFLGSIALVRAVGSVVLSGTWGQPTAEHAAEQSWSIQLEDPLATTLRGTVTIRGSASVDGGSFLGTREGHQVTGAITDAGGTVVAELSATIDGSLLAGTYSTPGGGSGQFTATLGSH